MIDYSRLHVGFVCSPLTCLYMEITYTPRSKTYYAIKCSIYGKRSPKISGPLTPYPLHKETTPPPQHQGIRVSFPLLYKHQTLNFSRYANSCTLKFLGDYSITNFSLAGTSSVLSVWFFSFVLQVHSLARVWTINSLTI